MDIQLYTMVTPRQLASELEHNAAAFMDLLLAMSPLNADKLAEEGVEHDGHGETVKFLRALADKVEQITNSEE